MRVGMCDCDCVRLFLCQVGSWAAPSPGSAISSAPHFRPVAGVCLLVYWWFSVSEAGCFVVCQLIPGGCLPGPGPLALLGLCLGVSGFWVHGWICSGIDGCRQGQWARHCSSLGLLHCAAGWFPWDSPLLFSEGVVVVLEVSLPGFPCSEEPLDV
ncbi:hypothetical protein ATANTOWER_012050 [Ataeniobius toweri]|uniref:Uncharacterized protein n=1 Tax=Ataeniobius toweri TaxID=208326 RepID=A0ABU7BIJ3_9TELE|nr:hypothetical protein [Ataeniobius toweri]